MMSTFPEEELERERAIMLADLQQVRDDMYRYPLRLFLHGAFPGHPYGFTIADVEAALSTATTASLQAWHEQVVAQREPWIVVAGDVDADKVAETVAAHIEAKARATTDSRPPQWPSAPVRIEESREKKQTAIVLAFPGVHRNHPDLPALQLLANAVAGLGGRLFEELRSKRSLAYTVAAYPVARALAGSFVSYIATSPEREEEARAGLLAELGRLRDELIEETELERAREYTVGSWQIRSQSNAAQVSDIMHALLVGEGLREIAEYEQRVRAVTAERIREVAQRYFDEQRLVEAVVRGTGGGR
jgi:zinc protease